MFPQTAQIKHASGTRQEVVMYAGKYTTADTPIWVRSLCIFVCMYVHTSCHGEEAIVRFADTLSRVAAGLVGVATTDPSHELPTPCGTMSGALHIFFFKFFFSKFSLVYIYIYIYTYIFMCVCV
jgi:hypothetical protein